MSRHRTADPLDRLTARERDVLALVAEGRSNAYIARRFGYGIKTVEKYVTVINTKLGIGATGSEDRRDVNTRVLAVLAYLRRVG
jgi:DNA-binding NarL/FixJ family response regulator